MTELQVRIERVVNEAVDIKLFHLVSADGAPLPTYTPGAHVDVQIAPGLVRSYSLCGDAADCSRYVIGVKREALSRGGSRAMHDTLVEGATVTIRAPRNNFPLHNGPAGHLLLAGGIGATPMICMARHLAACGGDFHLHYFTRSAEHTAFRSVLETPALAGRVTLHVGMDGAQVASVLRKLLGSRPADCHVYLCGPRPFIDAGRSTAAAAAWPENAVHVEHFSADGAALARSDHSFVVRLARTGGDFAVDEGQTIVAALSAHDIWIDTSCESGVCGTCMVEVVEGVPDHRDEVLSAAERQSCRKIIPCVSRSKSPLLVIDF